MRVYRVEFEGLDVEYNHAMPGVRVVSAGFAKAATLDALALDESVTLPTTGFKGGWDIYPTVTITAHDYQSYACNCCGQENPGDGFYDICHVCGWENEPGEGPEDEYGPNHMTLSEGQANFAKYGWYAKPEGDKL